MQKGEKKMKKNIEWLKKEIATEMIELESNRKERWSDVKYQTLRSVAQKLDQLDEPEVLTQEENINIVLDDLKEYIKEQQSLSQNVGLAHTSAGNDTHYRQYDYVLECINEYEPSDELQNLLVPNHELPVIPKYVAGWITKHRDTFDLYPMLKRLEKNSSKLELTYKWYRMNTHKFVNAYLTGEYEVEEEPLYHALIKGHDVSGDYYVYWNCDKFNNDVIVSRLHPPHDDFSTELSKSEWNELGINDSNADFIKVGEMK